MKKILLITIVGLGLLVSRQNSYACTNFLVTKGASADGSTMISYAADSHVLYGELYHWPAMDYPTGAMLDVYEWDTGKFLGKIPQVAHTYNVIGNINEYQVAIGETTYGGRKALKKQKGAIMDYGSLMYIALQRSKSAREAIKVITDLMEAYGYYSSGESLSISDKNEVWILEMIGKGDGEKGAIWVARMIPDGYVSGHANQARITTFPQKYRKGGISSDQVGKWYDNKVNTIFAKDVISFAKKKGLYNGKDKDFSFSDTYAPVDFGGARFCEARVWTMFRRVNSDMEQYAEYAAGHELEKRMPLWIKPNHKITIEEMMSFMRDHFEGTDLDMTKDLGAGPFANPYRWRPLTWKVDGEQYCNERAVATQQTGFSFVSQSRSQYSDPIGGILWFGVDDAATTVYNPIYCGVNQVPAPYKTGYGSLVEFKQDAAFWVFNQVSNLAYTRYSYISPIIIETQTNLEQKFIKSSAAISEAADKLYKLDSKIGIDFITDYSVNQAEKTVETWSELYQFLFAKFVDGNIKKSEGRTFIDNGNSDRIPVYPSQPGYGEEFYQLLIKSSGNHFKMKGEVGH